MASTLKRSRYSGGTAAMTWSATTGSKYSGLFLLNLREFDAVSGIECDESIVDCGVEHEAQRTLRMVGRVSTCRRAITTRALKIPESFFHLNPEVGGRRA